VATRQLFLGTGGRAQDKYDQMLNDQLDRFLAVDNNCIFWFDFDQIFLGTSHSINLDNNFSWYLGA